MILPRKEDKAQAEGYADGLAGADYDEYRYPWLSVQCAYASGWCDGMDTRMEAAEGFPLEPSPELILGRAV